MMKTSYIQAGIGLGLWQIRSKPIQPTDESIQATPEHVFYQIG